MTSEIDYWRVAGAELATPVVLTNRHGQTTWVNEAFVEHTGYTLDAMLGRKPGQVLQCEDTDRATVRHIAQRLSRLEPVCTNLLNQRRDGSLYWVRLQILPLRDEEGHIAAFVALQDNLAQAVLPPRATEPGSAPPEAAGADAQAPSQTDSRAEARAREAQTLVAHFCHEVRTNLDALMRLHEMLGTTPLAAEQREWLHYASLATQTLHGLVDDTLDLHQAHIGQLSYEPSAFAPQALLDGLVGELRRLALPRGVAVSGTVEGFTPGPAMRLWGDARKLRNALFNLGMMALKRTRRGRIELILRFSEQAALAEDIPLLEGHFEVRDSGDRPSDLNGSSGLEWAVTQQQVAVMGGSELQQHHEPGVGTAAGFSLLFTAVPAPADEPASVRRAANDEPPARGALGAAVGPAPLPDLPLGGLHLLVVDDNAVGRTVMARMLSRAGAEVVSVEHGLAALDHLDSLDRAQALLPDAVLMDLHMPVMDGLEATRAIRQHEGWARMPVLAISGTPSEENRRAARAAGMDLFLSKPVPRDELLRAVRQLAGIP